MLPKGILFDLDDTILAYTAIGAPTWRKVCETYADKAGCAQPQILFDHIQKASHWYWSDEGRHKKGRLDLHSARRDILGEAFRKLGIDDPELAREIADTFSDQREEDLYLFDGALETLAYLNRNGVALGLITNGAEDKQRRKIERFGLADYFQTIQIEGAMGFGKPEPVAYRTALNNLGLKAAEGWFVGDHLEFDVAAPQKLGMYGIWNDFNRQGLPPAAQIVPDRIIHAIEELMES